MDGIKRLWAGFVDLWCSWTHGGGIILRDPSGRVNWQCNKCGRWAEPIAGHITQSDQQIGLLFDLNNERTE